MLRIFPLAIALCIVGPLPALAQAANTDQASPAPENSSLDGVLFYQLLLGELNVRNSEPGAGYALILDAARKTNDPKLYQRAVEIAFQSRSGDAALQAARAWKEAQPQSREANRFVLQILIALNRLAETTDPLREEIRLAPTAQRSATISAVPRLYARAVDRKLAASVVEQALGDYLRQADTGAAAWSSVGRLRLAAGDTDGALDAAKKGQAVSAQAQGPALLALELMGPKLPQAEVIVRKHLSGQPVAELRMGYARALLDSQRYAEALQQLELVTTQRPDYAEAWLVRGVLLMQDNRADAAETALQRYVALAQAQPASEERERGLAQAYLTLAQIAEQRRDFTAAAAWLDRIENAETMISAQTRRASILARQGKLEEARALIRALPERDAATARTKLMAEVQLLRDMKQHQAAYDLLAQAAARAPEDTDLVYEQAMLAEKVGKLDEMERLLRQLIATKPEYHQSYNALGYSLADRNVRLPEARQLIKKALEFAPADPFITDSLGWVEFRMGNKAEALRILEGAYKARADAEIAAHLGEVLWSAGQRERAQAIWKEGLLLNPENETLLETLKRLGVKP